MRAVTKYSSPSDAGPAPRMVPSGLRLQAKYPFMGPSWYCMYFLAQRHRRSNSSFLSSWTATIMP